jgi:hypothetical protein
MKRQYVAHITTIPVQIPHAGQMLSNFVAAIMAVEA